MQKTQRLILFLGLLSIAAYLRISGLSWGLSSGYGHDLNFQPDEFVSLRGVFELDLLRGRIKAPGAYFEGTFNYYLWALPEAVLRAAPAEDVPFTDSTSMTRYSSLLYICRRMSILFDLCTIVVVFLGIKEATQMFYPALVGALCYSVLPMQVIYAHFMRTHILSNLLCALVIWFSLKLRQSLRWQLLFTVGIISGLAAATRYPVGIIVVIPCFYLLLNRDDSRSKPSGIWERVRVLLIGPLWLIAVGFIIGLFLGHPMLFLNLSSVAKAITGETLKYASLHQFNGVQLLNLAVVWKYITYVVPFAMYPLLWVVPYCAILYLVVRRSLYSVSIPILIFSLLYLYFMGKGYLGPYFARVTLVLFPGFCVLVGLACADLQLKMKNNRPVAVLLGCALLLVLGPSLAFDVAYGRAMQKKDAREVVRGDLQKLIGDAPATIGILQYGPYFYTAMPAAKPLVSDKVAVRLQNPGQDADFLLIGLPTQIEAAQMNAIVRQVEAQGKFTYEKSYRVPVKIFGHEFELVRFPQDMTYPFPTILLFRPRTPT
ncbi:MAG: hypothetical protein DMF24_09420 [Verrucomicrobia bacterium]|nr:MAG: hypothetical protein DMF24_09420 [Verrucomicrobiota bacterium]